MIRLILRRLKEHPASYAVQAGDMVAGIACAFGDVRPEEIIAANQLASPFSLAAGQVLIIP
ncbi:MAG TPA: LysM domain-containing protein [Anaerolineaceae bacterium]|nr:LysM domain-containing protein [Anaerolineaceae bacterium]HPN53641.1 LysM domain-containing protein [Anaerolineaceae bacterium]